jgi:hypothetical protein
VDLTLTFSRSRSLAFSQVIRECGKFQGFKLEGNTYILSTPYSLAIQNWEAFSFVLLTTMSWSSFSFEMDGRMIIGNSDIKNIYYSLQELMYCMKEYQSEYDGPAYCSQSIWGCLKLNSVEVLPHWYNKEKGWFTIGHLEDGTWIIDKSRILNTLLNEAKDNHAFNCPNFNEAMIANVLSALPDSIDIATRNWRLKTETKFVAGQFKQVCTGLTWIGDRTEFKPEQLLIKQI